MERKLILSVTLKDCDVQTFRCGGAGGQHRDKTSNGVRIVHRESGAVGASSEDRSQLQNKKLAWRRMVESKTFQAWLKIQTSREDARFAEAERRAQQQVERDMRDENIKIEYGVVE